MRRTWSQGALLCAHHVLIALLNPSDSTGGNACYYHHPSLAGEETEAQRGGATCLKPWSWDLNLGLSDAHIPPSGS